MATYLALVPKADRGWRVVGMGSDKAQVQADATRLLEKKRAAFTDIQRQKLVVVSKGAAERDYDIGLFAIEQYQEESNE